MSNLFNQLRDALAPRYQLERELGSGGMARVYLAIDVPHGRRVAIKVLHPELAGAVGQGRFLQEIRIASELAHPHILPLLDSGSAPAGESVLPYYVMPFVVGESLRAKLQREKQLPIDEAVSIAHDVAQALSYAHAHGVVHRDIKPENILLAGNEAVVADFGIARAIDRAADSEVITSAGLAVGTPSYMSPEQGSGHGEVDGRSDIYSLGCVLYEMLGGDPPFSGSSANAIAARHRVDVVPPLRTIRPSIPATLEESVLHALEKIPADRFRTAGQFADALARQNTPSSFQPVSGSGSRTPSGTATVATPWRPPRKTARIGGAILLLLGLVLLAAIGIKRWLEGRATPRYSDRPAWSEWRGWTGEIFQVFAAGDSLLIVKTLEGEVEAYDGQRWAPVTVPDSFELLEFFGAIPHERLLAVKQVRHSSGDPHMQYWWLNLTDQGFAPFQPIGDSVPDYGIRPPWWSDGEEVVLWLDAIRRSEGGSWVREPTGATGSIRQVWGTDYQHRFAIPGSRDSLLAFDGISWSSVAIPGLQGETHPAYQVGASFPDGAVIVVGDECTVDERCRPFLVKQDTVNGPWQRIVLPAMVGIPVTIATDTTEGCETSRFTMTGVAGRSRDDYYVWGSWSACDPGQPATETTGCPPNQPCSWHVREGRFHPIPELTGKVLYALGYVGSSTYALLDDGTVTRSIGGQWRAMSQVPGLPARLIGSSPRMVLRFNGMDTRYEPGWMEQQADFEVRPMPDAPPGIAAVPPRRLLVSDTVAALLTGHGTVYTALCRDDRVTRPGPPRGALRCDGWRPLASSSPNILDIAILPGGGIIGVGDQGVAVVWRENLSTVERLPPEAKVDSLWGIAIGPRGQAIAVGNLVVIERDSLGHWTVIRRILPDNLIDPHFTVLADGDLVLMRRVVEIWDRVADSIPVAILHQHRLGDARVGALHALADGRLVLGLANPEEPLAGGRLLVWGSPARANQSQAVPLPINMDITDLADDGRFLYVVGRGGSLRIPIDSLPFTPPSSR